MSDDATRDDPTINEAPPPRRRTFGRKLLVAAVGVATISYVACSQSSTSGNLVAPPPEDAQADVQQADVGPDVRADVLVDRATSGNLIAPPPDVMDVPQQPDAPMDRVISGNLIAPPPDVMDAPQDQADPPLDRVISGNLIAPPPDVMDVPQDRTDVVALDRVISGNLIAPPPDSGH